MEIFAFDDYVSYLISRLGPRNKRTGLRRAAAQTLNCHTTYISQVLAGKVHLSLEQAIKFNDFLGHSAEESHFFVLLVSQERAGSNELKTYYKNQIEQIRLRHRELRERLQGKQDVSGEDAHRFYSQWFYQAVQTLLSIPELQNKEALASYLRMPENKISEILQFLLRAGLALNDGERYKIGPTHLFLDKTSSHINKHHMNWRLQAMDSLDRAQHEDLHYSAVATFARKDAERLRENILQCIAANSRIITGSKEEVAYVSCFDFFELKK